MTKASSDLRESIEDDRLVTDVLSASSGLYVIVCQEALPELSVGIVLSLV
jgi:hypothetical protein